MAPVPLKRRTPANGSSIRSCGHRQSLSRPHSERYTTRRESLNSRALYAVNPCSVPARTDQIDAPNQILFRRLEDGDSLEHLTDLLHRAFSRIGRMGIPCSCVTQPPEVTRQRIARGDCFVALSGDLIVGTVTLCGPEAAADSTHYRDSRVGTLHQLGVDPLFHGKGIGQALLRLAEQWALNHGYLWLALETPEAADHLVNYYQCQGFRIIEIVQFSGRPYRSVVLSKPVAAHRIANRGLHAVRRYRNTSGRSDATRMTEAGKGLAPGNMSGVARYVQGICNRASSRKRRVEALMPKRKTNTTRLTDWTEHHEQTIADIQDERRRNLASRRYTFPKVDRDRLPGHRCDDRSASDVCRYRGGSRGHFASHSDHDRTARTTATGRR